MICLGIDPSLAAWLAEQDVKRDAEPLPLLPLIVLIATSLALALVATIGHA